MRENSKKKKSKKLGYDDCLSFYNIYGIKSCKGL